MRSAGAWKVGRGGPAGDRGAAVGIHLDGPALIIANAADITGVDQGVAGEDELAHEHVVGAAVIAAGAGEIGRGCIAGHVDGPGDVQGQGLDHIGARAAEIGGIEQRGPIGGQFGDEGIAVIGICRLVWVGDREIGGEGLADEIGYSQVVDGETPGFVP